MNIEKRSMVMKNPYTPVERRVNQRKNSFGMFFSCHVANVPVKTIMLERSSITTEMPSTPTA